MVDGQLKQVKKKVESKNEFDTLLYQSKSVLDNKALSDEDKTTIQSKLNELEIWMSDNPNAEISDYNDKKQELQDFVMKYSAKTSEQNMPEPMKEPEDEQDMGPRIEEID